MSCYNKINNDPVVGWLVLRSKIKQAKGTECARGKSYKRPRRDSHTQPRLEKGERVRAVETQGEGPATGFPLSLPPSQRNFHSGGQFTPKAAATWTEMIQFWIFFFQLFSCFLPSIHSSPSSAQTVTGGQPLPFLHAAPEHFPDISSEGGTGPGPVTGPEEGRGDQG